MLRHCLAHTNLYSPVYSTCPTCTLVLLIIVPTDKANHFTINCVDATFRASHETKVLGLGDKYMDKALGCVDHTVVDILC